MICDLQYLYLYQASDLKFLVLAEGVERDGSEFTIWFDEGHPVSASGSITMESDGELHIDSLQHGPVVLKLLTEQVYNDNKSVLKQMGTFESLSVVGRNGAKAYKPEKG